MATMQEIITRAFRKSNIVSTNDSPTADEAAEGLTSLNGMLHEWKLRGVDLEYTSLTLSGTFPLGEEYQDGVVYMLAERLSSDYMAPRSFDADDFFRTIQAAYMTINTVSLPKALTDLPSKRARDGTLGFEH